MDRVEKYDRVYVVAEERVSDKEERKVWTLSTDPEDTGWETDSGTNGYGLTKGVAEFYAKCINYCIEKAGLCPACNTPLEKCPRCWRSVCPECEIPCSHG